MKQRMRMLVVLLIIGLAVPSPLLAQSAKARVSQEPQPSPEVDNRIDAREVFDTFRRAHPEVYKDAYDAAIARGWKPTQSFEGYKERTAPGAMRKRAIGGFQHDYMNGWDGDISIWYWDDGNPDNVEYKIITRSYQTGEDLIVEGSYRPWSDYDGANDYFNVRGGTRWDSLGRTTRLGFNQEYEKHRLALIANQILAVQLTTTQRRCQRKCLSSKLANVARTAAWATGASIVGCGRAAAFSGPGFGVSFFGCVGLGALLGTGAGLVNQFMISEDCKTQCGVS